MAVIRQFYKEGKMPLVDDVEIPRRTMILFFMIDTSGSMEGEKIGAVNFSMKEVGRAVKEVADESTDAIIKIAVMEFSAGVRWVTSTGPVDVDKFNWIPLNVDGTTDLGAAFRELNGKLSSKGFMQSATGSFAPVIFLMSDGDPTDDWQGGLQELKQNKWFQVAQKVAVAIGDDVNLDNLKEFTGNKELVLKAGNAAMLKRMIKFVAVTSSRVASKSSAVGGAVEGEKAREVELIEAIKAEQEDIAASPDAGETWAEED
jgi:uncharacterized protein YegL